MIGDLPAEDEEDRDGIEGYPAAGRGPAQELGQDGAQGTKVHQAQGEVKVGEVFPGRTVLQVLPAQVDVVGTIGFLGRKGYVGQSGPDQG